MFALIASSRAPFAGRAQALARRVSRRLRSKKDYPTVAPAYAAQRSDLAKSLGLGRKPGAKALAAAKKTTSGHAPTHNDVAGRARNRQAVARSRPPHTSSWSLGAAATTGFVASAGDGVIIA